MKEHKCPKCGISESVIVGAFILSCVTCGWNHNNEYPCNVCGKPSFSSCSIGERGENIYHGCRDHPASEVYKRKIDAINAGVKSET